MWKAFRNSTLKEGHAPQARILYDKFHILTHLGEAMDKVRKREYARLSGKDRRFIKGQKYTLLSHWGNLTIEGKQALKLLFKANTAVEQGLPPQGVVRPTVGLQPTRAGHGGSSTTGGTPSAGNGSNPFEKFALMVESTGTASRPIATRKTRCLWASSRASTTRSEPFSGEPTASEMRSTSA